MEGLQIIGLLCPLGPSKSELVYAVSKPVGVALAKERGVLDYAPNSNPFKIILKDYVVVFYHVASVFSDASGHVVAFLSTHDLLRCSKSAKWKGLTGFGLLTVYGPSQSLTQEFPALGKEY